MSMYKLKNGFFVDTETGVEYCCGVAVEYQSHFYYYPTCPRYKSDGSLYILSHIEIRNQVEETKKSNAEKLRKPINI